MFDSTAYIQQINIAALQHQFKKRRLAIVPNVLQPHAHEALVQEAIRLQSLAQRNGKLMQVHSGQLHAEHSLFLCFAKSPTLTTLVRQVTGEPVGVCPGSLAATYSLYKADFGTKLNYYNGDGLGSIGWHYDKNNSWKDNTYVVIYTIVLRPVVAEDINTIPTTYEIIEHGRRMKFAIAENSLHIHDTNHVYHRAVTPAGWRRWIFILHFTLAPCEPNPQRVGFTPRLILRNAAMRMYVETCVECNPVVLGVIGATIAVLMALLIKVNVKKRKKKSLL